MSTALFIGRFQPFHIGHLWAVHHILQEHDHVKIGVGSSQAFGTETNPYSGRDRKQMIEVALDAEGFRNYDVFLVPDIPNDEEWVDYVVGIVGKFDVVFTGHDLVRDLMEKKRIHVEWLPRWKEINASEVRRRIEANENWKELVPIAIHGFLEA
jgi:nicotinamide-nucleotide adenylyltransferase